MVLWGSLMELISFSQARLTTTSAWRFEMKYTDEQIRRAEQCLIDNGVEPDEAWVVLQALGYILLDEELYPET